MTGRDVLSLDRSPHDMCHDRICPMAKPAAMPSMVARDLLQSSLHALGPHGVSSFDLVLLSGFCQQDC